MAEKPESLTPDTSWNYFTYFTEIEEHFQRARGSGLFLLSPLDWALIETWKLSGVPLEAVLRGIDSAFEKWRAKRSKVRQVNSLAYCTQAVYDEAQRMAAAVSDQPQATVKAPFEVSDVRDHLLSCAAALAERTPFDAIAGSLQQMAAEVDVHFADLERLEQRLTAMEEKMSAIAKTSQSDADMLDLRIELDSALRPYRGKMTAEQLAMLERQFLEKRLLENLRLPRLSLFYLQPRSSS